MWLPPAPRSAPLIAAPSRRDVTASIVPTLQNCETSQQKNILVAINAPETVLNSPHSAASTVVFRTRHPLPRYPSLPPLARKKKTGTAWRQPPSVKTINHSEPNTKKREPISRRPPFPTNNQTRGPQPSTPARSPRTPALPPRPASRAPPRSSSLPWRYTAASRPG